MELVTELLRHIFGMAWKIAWGLILGFGISAVIQTFVSRDAVAEHLGGFGLGPLLKATGFGCASSSCSYAAAAMSKSLFQKWAHIVTATAFLFAATNLVIEIGLVIAGSLAALVPRSWWETLFMSPAGGQHPGLWVSLENAVVGPVIAILSFVCSVGNIPLAAVLWNNGISFGGVVAFIFADLITIPMVLVYREYYGWKPALVYAGYLLVTIVIVALVVDGVFRWTGLAPEALGAGAQSIREMDYFAWDYTTWLNLVFLPLGGWLALMGVRGGEGSAHGHG